MDSQIRRKYRIKDDKGGEFEVREVEGTTLSKTIFGESSSMDAKRKTIDVPCNADEADKESLIADLLAGHYSGLDNYRIIPEIVIVIVLTMIGAMFGVSNYHNIVILAASILFTIGFVLIASEYFVFRKVRAKKRIYKTIDFWQVEA
ncbi:MAG: hypothetical protein ACYCQJ_12930 [Nitrososphaerales archaeon]